MLLARETARVNKLTRPQYVMFHKGAPLGWPRDSDARNLAGITASFGYPGPQGPYYCANGADVSFGREVSEVHLLLCKKAGINCSGTNAEVGSGFSGFRVFGFRVSPKATGSRH